MMYLEYVFTYEGDLIEAITITYSAKIWIFRHMIRVHIYNGMNI